MRLRFLPLILALLSCAHALTININSPNTIINSGDNITVNYEIILDHEDNTNYVISLVSNKSSVVLLNETETFADKEGVINYNAGTIEAGNYSLNLIVNNPSISINQAYNKRLIILENIGLNVNLPSEAYVSNDETTINALLTNNGNTDLSISAYFKRAQSDITIKPQSLQLKVNETRNLEITIKKPTSNYETTLVINLASNEEELSNEYPINITIPVINLTMSNVKIKESSNETFIEALINNEGNKDLNATVTTRTFSLLEGFKTIDENLNIARGASINYSLTIPKKDVISLTLTYNNGTDYITIKEELSTLSKIPLDFKLSQDRLILLGVLVIVIIAVLYFKYFKKARP